MSIVHGVRRVDFKTPDGKKIEGYSCYYGNKIGEQYGNGFTADKFFISERMADEVGFVPCAGDEIEVFFNKYGKVASYAEVKG